MLDVRTILFGYWYVGLVLLVAYGYLWGLRSDKQHAQTFLPREAITCSDDCPLPAVLVFISEGNQVSVKDAQIANDWFYYDPESKPFIFTAHPNAKYRTVFSNLYYLTRQNRNYPIYFRKNEMPLPSFEVPYWPEGTDFSSFEARDFVIEVLPEQKIRIKGQTHSYNQIQDALEHVMVLAKNPKIRILTDPDAEHYAKTAAKFVCENIEFECSYAEAL